MLNKEYLHRSHRVPLFDSLIELCLTITGSRRFATKEAVFVGRIIGGCRNLKRFYWYRHEPLDENQAALLLSRLFLDSTEETNLVELSLFFKASCRIITALLHKNKRPFNYLDIDWVAISRASPRVLASELGRQQLVGGIPPRMLDFQEISEEFKIHALEDLETSIKNYSFPFIVPRCWW